MSDSIDVTDDERLTYGVVIDLMVSASQDGGEPDVDTDFINPAMFMEIKVLFIARLGHVPTRAEWLMMANQTGLILRGQRAMAHYLEHCGPVAEAIDPFNDLL